MTLDTWLLYVGTVLIFMIAPGPSHLLMLSTSMSSGFRRSVATAAGDLSANAIQILLAGLGLAAVLTASRYGFVVIKWVGVAYLVWLGVRQIMASFREVVGVSGLQRSSLLQLFLRGFVTSAANPKAVVFFAALFPQFIDASESLVTQIATLGATYIAIDAAFLLAYGRGAEWLAARLQGRHQRLVERLAGTSLIGAAVLLGLRSVSQD